MNESIGHIKDVVEARYGCKARHIGSEAVIVRGEPDGQVVWDGVVETFELQDWKRCHAWNPEGKDGNGCVTVLEQSFVIFRQRHARMVERVIGRRQGTGGSAGVDYLDTTALKYRVFREVWAVRTLLLRKSDLPALRKPEIYGFASGAI